MNISKKSWLILVSGAFFGSVFCSIFAPLGIIRALIFSVALVILFCVFFYKNYERKTNIKICVYVVILVMILELIVPPTYEYAASAFMIPGSYSPSFSDLLLIRGLYLIKVGFYFGLFFWIYKRIANYNKDIENLKKFIIKQFSLWGVLGTTLIAGIDPFFVITVPSGLVYGLMIYGTFASVIKREPLPEKFIKS